MCWRKSVWMCSILLVFSNASSYAEAQSSLTQAVRNGFAIAQACEKEIDDDMASYEECVGHAVNRIAIKDHVLLGLHFQVWLMADLAARQNSPRAMALRTRHAQGLKQQLQTTGLSLSQLCQIKKVSCSTVRARMGGNLG